MARPLKLQKFEVWESTSQTAIDGPKLGDLRVVIQYASRTAYNAAAAAAPIEGNYAQKRIFSYTGSDPQTLLPSSAFSSYDAILDPYFWAGLICYTQNYNRNYEKCLERTERLLFRPPLTIGAYIHLTYPGSRYGYVSGKVYASSTDNASRGGGAPIFASGASRVDYQAGTVSASGLIGGLFSQMTIWSSVAADVWSGRARRYEGVGGDLKDWFIDEDEGRLCSGPIHVNLTDFGEYWGSDYFGGRYVSWGPYHAASGPYAPTASYAAIATDPHAQWLLGAPGEERASAYKYLYGDASGTVYSYIEGVQIGMLDGLAASSFRAYGMDSPPPPDLLMLLDGPVVYRWTDLRPSALPLTATVNAIPTANTIECVVDLTSAVTIISITSDHAGDVRASYSTDDGASWTDPVSMEAFLTASHLDLLRGASRRVRFRLSLESSDAVVRSFRVRYGKEA